MCSPCNKNSMLRKLAHIEWNCQALFPGLPITLQYALKAECKAYRNVNYINVWLGRQWSEGEECLTERNILSWTCSVNLSTGVRSEKLTGVSKSRNKTKRWDETEATHTNYKFHASLSQHAYFLCYGSLPASIVLVRWGYVVFCVFLAVPATFFICSSCHLQHADS